MEDFKAFKSQPDTIARQVAEMLDDDPPSPEPCCHWLPWGIKIAFNILLSVGNFQDFAHAGHFAGFIRIAPVTRQSGTSIREELPVWVGNKRINSGGFR